MRLLVTADLHYNHARSRTLADQLIDEMNRAIAEQGCDVLLVVGDTAAADGDALEQCLSRFHFDGPKLFVAGNHELWTRRDDSHAIIQRELPDRVYALGWHWLQTEPYIAADRSHAIVGSVGWYDYSFAVPQLQIPTRFYAHKVSPGAASRLSEFAPLLADADDVSSHALDIVARWNDGKFVKLHRSDASFLNELLTQLSQQLDSLADVPHIVAAVHHVPFPELLPPRHGSQWDFARAYLGSVRMGELLQEHPNVRTVICGHSHFAVDATIGAIRAINIGSGYRAKLFRTIEIKG